jgi:hypothetical protein
LRWSPDDAGCHRNPREGKPVYTNLGLNDAVIREGPISHVIHLSIASDNIIWRISAGDGVIICHAHRLHGILSFCGRAGDGAGGAGPGGVSHLHP